MAMFMHILATFSVDRLLSSWPHYSATFIHFGHISFGHVLSFWPRYLATFMHFWPRYFWPQFVRVSTACRRACISGPRYAGPAFNPIPGLLSFSVFLSFALLSAFPLIQIAPFRSLSADLRYTRVGSL